MTISASHHDSSPVYSASEAKSKILVGVCSNTSRRERRQAARSTWLTSIPSNIQYRFFVGSGPDPGEPDTFQVDADDQYEFLPAKILAFFRRALVEFDFEWIFKCDDDDFVALNRLSELVRPGYGIVAGEGPAQSGSSGGGAGYFLSRPIVEALVADRQLRSAGPEGLILGEAAIRHGAKPLLTPRLGAAPSTPPLADNDMVTAQRCPPERMALIHRMLGQLPRETVEAHHPYWQDEILLFESGEFIRRGTGCPGKWRRTDDGLLHLEWASWPPEVFRARPGADPRRSVHVLYRENAQFAADEAAPLMFDIGCHYGETAHMFHKLGWRVIGVEANPAIACDLASSSGFHVVTAAVGNRFGLSDFFVNDAKPDWSSLSEDVADRTGKGVRRITAAVVTLRSLMEKFGVPDYLKLDIEGSELAAIEGMGDYRPPVLSFEVDHLGASPEQLRALARRLGYAWFSWAPQASNEIALPKSAWSDIAHLGSPPTPWCDLFLSKEHDFRFEAPEPPRGMPAESGRSMERSARDAGA